MVTARRTLNFISDIATPHINQLLRAVVARGDLELLPWYSSESRPDLYSWKENPTHAVVPARVFGDRRPDPGLLRHALGRPDDHYVIVGWSNPTTRVLIPMLAALGRRFAYFTDHPHDARARGRLKHMVREAYFGMLRRRATVFAVGRQAVDYFVAGRRFDPSRVCNLPIPVPSFSDLPGLRAARPEVRARYRVGEGELFAVSGSRLIPEKGFDLLLGGIARLDAAERARVRVLIVGQGAEEANLKSLARELGLADRVMFEPWLDFGDFSRAMCAADVVLHPARFDAYGGTTLTAVGLGVAVIGSRGAGSAVELIRHGKTGFLYDAEDTAALAGHIRYFLRDRARAAEMSRAAERLAPAWSPERIADILASRLREDADVVSRHHGRSA
jgi:glycosyltransferase involved in cell wall biosynthesis